MEWLYFMLQLWGIVAYASAAVAGFRALAILSHTVPPWPPCIVAESTAWLFGKARGRRWCADDYFTVGVLITAMASLMMMSAQLVPFVAAKQLPNSWEELHTMSGYTGTLMDLAGRLGHVALGSGLIILHAGAALVPAQGRARDE